MTTQLKNGAFIDVTTRTFTTAFDGPQRAQFSERNSLIGRRIQRASRRAARSL